MKVGTCSDRNIWENKKMKTSKQVNFFNEPVTLKSGQCNLNIIENVWLNGGYHSATSERSCLQYSACL